MIENRIALYRFLGIGFTYPQEGFDEVLSKSVELIAESYTALNKNGYKITGIKNLKSSLKELSSKKLDEWQGIYTSLFISGYPSTPLHPYESFYKEGLLVSESSDEIVELYQSCGIEIFDEKEFPDFISFETEFASFILEHQDGCLPVFKPFFFNHLFSWIFDFFHDVQKYEKTPQFYKSLAQIGETFLKKEQKILEEIADE
jgi:TorA maturation chaperone TorD